MSLIAFFTWVKEEVFVVIRATKFPCGNTLGSKRWPFGPQCLKLSGDRATGAGGGSDGEKELQMEDMVEVSPEQKSLMPLQQESKAEERPEQAEPMALQQESKTELQKLEIES